MAKMEKLEMDAHRAQLISDVKHLVEKYRSIFEWDVPEVNEALSDRMILKEVRQALDRIEAGLPARAPT